MRKLLLLLLLCATQVQAQSIYSWTPGVNPGWDASNNDNTHLRWQQGHSKVSNVNWVSGNWTRYSKDQNSTYTSKNFNISCPNASMFRVTVDLSVNLEPNYDLLHFEYTTDNVNWNTVETYNQFTGLKTYNITNSTNIRFRFRFVSDGSVNSYSSWFTTYIYYADIKGFNIDCTTYLPIEILSFTGDCNELSWSTASEKNNDYFLIERTEDGINWFKDGTVAGSGNSNTVKNYNYKVKNSGVWYYRLTQIDFNGDQETFETISVTCGQIKIPNPNNGNFTVGEDCYITDMAGKVIYRGNGEVTNMPSGMYIVVTSNLKTKMVVR